MMYLLGLLMFVTLVNWTYSQSHVDMCDGNDRRIKKYLRLNVSGEQHCLFSFNNQTPAVSISSLGQTCVDFVNARRLCHEFGGSKLLQINSVDQLDAVIKVAPEFGGGDIEFPIGVQRIKRVPLYATNETAQIDFAKVTWDSGYTLDLNSNPYNETTETFLLQWWKEQHKINDRFIMPTSCKFSNTTCFSLVVTMNTTGEVFPRGGRMMVVCHQHPDYPLGQSPPNECDVQDNVEKANFTVDNKRHCVFLLFDDDAMTWVQDKNGFFYNKSKADTACNAKHARLPQVTSVPVFRGLVNAVRNLKRCSEVDAMVMIPLGIKDVKILNPKMEPLVINETVSMVMDNGKTIDTKMFNASSEFVHSRPFVMLIPSQRRFTGYVDTSHHATVICDQSESKQGGTTPTGKTGPPVKTGQTGQTGPPKTTGQTGPPEQTGQTGPPGQTGQTGQTGHTPAPQPGQTTGGPPHQFEPTVTTGVGGKRGNACIIIGLIGASMIMVSLGK